jgi:hypothetical protein
MLKCSQGLLLVRGGETQDQSLQSDQSRTVQSHAIRLPALSRQNHICGVSEFAVGIVGTRTTGSPKRLLP